MKHHHHDVESIADRLAALETRLSAIERLVLPPPPRPWWEVLYPLAYPSPKESNNG